MKKNMKTLLRIIILLPLFAGFMSCSDEDDETILPPLEVNYANIAGTWYLSEWNGEKMNDSRYYYIVFDRKAENGKRTYQIYTNLNSATSQRISGAFVLEHDEDLGDMVSGTYDYQLSTDDEWSHEYIITDLYEGSMVWTAKDDVAEVRIYTRCEKVPDEIVVGTKSH